MRPQPGTPAVVKDVGLNRQVRECNSREARHRLAVSGRQQVFGQTLPGRTQKLRARRSLRAHRDERPGLILIALLAVVTLDRFEVIARKGFAKSRAIGRQEQTIDKSPPIRL